MDKPSNKYVRISLSHEELLYLMQVLGIPSLPGLPSNLLQPFNKEQLTWMFSSAERSLRARLFIEIKGPAQINVDSLVAGLLIYCLQSDLGLILSQSRQGAAPDFGIYHLGPKINLYHQLEGSLHHFTLYDSTTSLLNDLAQSIFDITENLAIPPMNEEFMPIQVDRALLVALQLVSSQEGADMQKFNDFMSQSQNISSDLAHYLSQEFSEYFLRSLNLVCWNAPSDHPMKNLSLNFIHTQRGLWSFSLKGDQAKVELHRLSLDQMQTSTSKFLEAFN